MSRDTLERDLRAYFKNDKDVEITICDMPFMPGPVRLVFKKKWVAGLFFEQGKKVTQRIGEIEKLAGKDVPDGFSECERWVRVVFGDDEGEEFFDDMIEIMVFLEKIPDAIVYDITQNKFSN